MAIHVYSSMMYYYIPFDHLSLRLRSTSVLFLQQLLSDHYEYGGHIARCGEEKTDTGEMDSILSFWKCSLFAI